MFKRKKKRDLCSFETDAVPDAPRPKVESQTSEFEETKTKEKESKSKNRDQKNKSTGETFHQMPRGGEIPKGPFYNPTSSGQIINISNSSRIHVGNNIVYKVKNVRNNTVVTERKTKTENEDYNRPNKHEHPKEIPEEIKNAFNNLKPATESDFYIVKNSVSNWRKLAEKLCPDILYDQEFTNLSNEEATFKILQEWSQLNARNATIGILCNDLWDISEFLAAEKLAMAHS